MFLIHPDYSPKSTLVFLRPNGILFENPKFEIEWPFVIDLTFEL